MNKKLIAIISALSLCVSTVACSKSKDSNKSETTSKSSISIESMETETLGEADTFIKLGTQTTIEGKGANVENNKVTITSAGTYSISGKLDDGQIVINVGKEDKVGIILNGVDITSSNSAPIYASSAKKVVVSIADGTENKITDSENYVFEDESTDEPNAAIFSKGDLIFIGSGNLTVTGNYNHGIVSKDKLKIQSGNISVNSKNDGIKGKDCINVTDGNVTIKSNGDGMQSNNDTDTSKGYVLIEGGKINITSGEDGIQAETQALIKDGEITINSGGGSENSTKSNSKEGGMPDKNMGEVTEETISTKAIKASSNLIIEGGSINIDSSEDGLHSNDSITINGGTMNIDSGDDGIHSDLTLTINGGTINIPKSYEGIESEVININDGNIHVTASDDGINASESSSESSTETTQGKPGESTSSKAQINISGGYIYVDANGDGVDSNGNITMKEGTLIVNGPTNNGNGTLDYDGEFDIIGGTLIAAGSSGMIQVPTSSSSQKIMNISLTSQEANTILNIQSEAKKDILTFEPAKTYQSVVVSTPDIKSDTKYTVSIGGSSTGKATDGLYSGGSYSKGTEIGTATVSEAITKITQEGATTSGSMGGPGGFGGKGRTRENMNQSTNNTTVQ